MADIYHDGNRALQDRYDSRRLADLVLSPLLFIGSALLYFDQVSRQDGARVPRG